MFGKWIYIWLAFAVKVEASHWGCPSKYIWVDIDPKREKNAEKWHFQFEDVAFCYLYLAKESCSLPHCFLFKVAPPICASTLHLCCPYLCARLRTRASRTDVCTYARAFQPQCCFFAVTSVTPREKSKPKQSFFGRKMTKQNRTFSSFVHRIWGAWMRDLLKYALAWCSILITSTLWKCCDTCDSKKAKTPVLRAYACAWEEIVFTNLILMNTLHPVCAMYWKFSKKEATFLQHLQSGCSKSGFFTKHLAQRGFHPTRGLEKTTCCFVVNDVSFYSKHRVVFQQTSIAFSW